MAPHSSVITSLYNGHPLVPHFLHHHLAIGFDRIFLLLRGVCDSVFEEVVAAAAGLPVSIYRSPSECFSDSDKRRFEIQVLEENKIGLDDYVAFVDLDEFQEYPCSVKQLVREMDRRNDWAVRGWIIDRIAGDGQLLPIVKSPSIFEQFPCVADISASLMKACTQKVMLCRRRVRLQGWCAHRAENAVTDVLPISGRYVVHHFKWTAGIEDRLRSRLRTPDSLSPLYQQECNRFLSHFEQHGRIDIDDPSLNVRYLGAFQYP